MEVNLPEVSYKPCQIFFFNEQLLRSQDNEDQKLIKKQMQV